VRLVEGEEGQVKSHDISPRAGDRNIAEIAS
jgi:hypothetical protein